MRARPFPVALAVLLLALGARPAPGDEKGGEKAAPAPKISVGRSSATGTPVALFSINSRAACIMPCSVEGAQCERSVTGFASSAYTASELM